MFAFAALNFPQAVLKKDYTNIWLMLQITNREMNSSLSLAFSNWVGCLHGKQ